MTSTASAIAVSQTEPLQPGNIYSWEELASRFGFAPGYLARVGGMVPNRASGTLLLITHPGGGKSFDYQDEWDGNDLIYTGRGQVGDQKRTGPNLDVAENRRPLLAFEGAGPKRLRYLGNPTCIDEWVGRAPDDNGLMRDVLQFRLRFDAGQGSQAYDVGASLTRNGSDHRPPHRTPRPFRGSNVKPPALPKRGVDPEQRQVRLEKAVKEHGLILDNLDRVLRDNDWQEIEEIPTAIDLWATDSRTERRVLFEAKTIDDGMELAQCRSALAQLLEYRLEYADQTDGLCLAVNGPISLRRARLLNRLGIAVLVVDESGCTPANDLGSALASRLG